MVPFLIILGPLLKWAQCKGFLGLVFAALTEKAIFDDQRYPLIQENSFDGDTNISILALAMMQQKETQSLVVVSRKD